MNKDSRRGADWIRPGNTQLRCSEDSSARRIEEEEENQVSNGNGNCRRQQSRQLQTTAGEKDWDNAFLQRIYHPTGSMP
jgi:hypothetical protein